MAKVKIVQPFTHKGKPLKVGEEVTLSAAAANLYIGIDHAEPVEEKKAASKKAASKK